jgi:hypothetical protein
LLLDCLRLYESHWLHEIALRFTLNLCSLAIVSVLAFGMLQHGSNDVTL